MWRYALIAPALALVGACTTPAERAAIREAAVSELIYRIEMLQEFDLARVEVDPVVLIAADAACSMLAIGSPYLAEAINRSIEADESKTTPAEVQDSLHDICDLIRIIMVQKAEAPVLADGTPLNADGTLAAPEMEATQ